MKKGRQVKRSKLLIRSGVQFIIACLILLVISALFKMEWLLETVTVVAVLVTMLTVFEYWTIRHFKRN